MHAKVCFGFSINQNDSRDWTVTVVFYTLQNTWGSNVLTEVVARVCCQSEVTINKRHK